MVSKTEFAAIKAKISGRKVSRAKNAAFQSSIKAVVNGSRMPQDVRNAPKRHRNLKSAIKRGPLAKKIVRLLGLLDAKHNGILCRLGPLCPAYPKIGIHNGDRAYHIIPQRRGNAVRFLPENVIWACNAANCGEYYHRALYRDKHIALFGKEHIETLETKAHEIFHYSTADLMAIAEQLKAKIEAG